MGWKPEYLDTLPEGGSNTLVIVTGVPRNDAQPVEPTTYTIDYDPEGDTPADAEDNAP